MITRFHVHNFKSLRDVEVELDPLTLFVGRSGSGKSNFVASIKFLRNLIANGPQILQQAGAAWKSILCANRDDDVLAFDVDFRLSGLSSVLTYRIDIGGQPNLKGDQVFQSSFAIRQEQFLVGGRMILHHAQQKWIVAPNSLQLPQPFGVTLGRVYGIPEIQFAYQFLARGIGCYDFPSTVLQPSNRAGTEPFVGLDDDGGNYLRVFETIANNIAALDTLRELVAALRKLNASITTIQPAHDDAAGNLLVGHTVGSDGVALPLNLGQESEGFRRFFAHLLAIYQNPPKQTLVFEEPEKGVYPGALSTLADFFERSAAKSQILLTTHSPELLDHFAPENIRVVEMPIFDTRIGRLASGQMSSIADALMSTGELLTVDEPKIEDAAESAGAVK